MTEHNVTIKRAHYGDHDEIIDTAEAVSITWYTNTGEVLIMLRDKKHSEPDVSIITSQKIAVERPVIKTHEKSKLKRFCTFISVLFSSTRDAFIAYSEMHNDLKMVEKKIKHIDTVIKK